MRRLNLLLRWNYGVTFVFSTRRCGKLRMRLEIGRTRGGHGVPQQVFVFWINLHRTFVQSNRYKINWNIAGEVGTLAKVVSNNSSAEPLGSIFDGGNVFTFLIYYINKYCWKQSEWFITLLHMTRHGLQNLQFIQVWTTSNYYRR